MEKYTKIQSLALEVIDDFPKSYSGKPYLRMKNGKRLFFDIFMRKYGLTGARVKYSDLDLSRRMKLIEFFKWFVLEFDLEEIGKNKWENRRYQKKSKFYTMIVDRQTNGMFQLISFYPHV